jgi:hypothetical protein
MLRLKIHVFVLCIVVNFSLINTGFASSSDSIHVVKISGEDERAVIKTSVGKMQVIKPGDVIGDNRKVVEITSGRVVLQEKNGNATETVIIRLESGKQRVERVKKAPEKQEKVYAAAIPQEQKQESKEPPKGKRKKDKSKQQN